MELYYYRLIDIIIEKYEKLGFSNAQIRELRRGIEAGVDISKFDNINISPSDMFNIRWNLIHEKYDRRNKY